MPAVVLITSTTSDATTSLSAASTSAVQSAPSPSASSSSSSQDARDISVGLILGLIGLLIVASLIYYTYRLHVRHRQSQTHELIHPISPGTRRQTVVDPRDIANRISPYGASDEPTDGPQFADSRRPGVNMRMAQRRSDGSWMFASPREPFNPAGVSELDLVPPSPSASTYSFGKRERSRSPFGERDRKDDKSKMWMATNGHDVYPPPPAYQQEAGFLTTD